MTDTQRPWDRLTTESDPAYEACAAYLEARWLDLWEPDDVGEDQPDRQHQQSPAVPDLIIALPPSNA